MLKCDMTPGTKLSLDNQPLKILLQLYNERARPYPPIGQKKQCVVACA